MICIHTYVPNFGVGEVSKSLLYQMTLSTILAKQFFKKMVLYTTNEIKDIVKEVGIPYDDIITEPFDGYSGGTFSIPKMITYSLQNEPFIHIDIDMFLYDLRKKIDEYDVIYAFKDFPYGTNGDYETHKGMYETYFKGTFEMRDNIPMDFKPYIDFINIPNMSIFGGNDYETISKSSKYCLSLYYDNKEHFDSNYYHACVIEQLFMSSAIDMIGGLKERNYVYESSKNFGVTMESKSLTDASYPVTLQFFNNKIQINGENDLYNYSTYNFNCPVHLCGYKNLDVLLFIIKETIVQRFNGIKYVDKIEKLVKHEWNYDKITRRYYYSMRDKYEIWFKREAHKKTL